jgi:hypothetical protein
MAMSPRPWGRDDHAAPVSANAEEVELLGAGHDAHVQLTTVR